MWITIWSKASEQVVSKHIIIPTSLLLKFPLATDISQAQGDLCIQKSLIYHRFKRPRSARPIYLSVTLCPSPLLKLKTFPRSSCHSQGQTTLDPLSRSQTLSAFYWQKLHSHPASRCVTQRETNKPGLQHHTEHLHDNMVKDWKLLWLWWDKAIWVQESREQGVF